MEVKGVSAYRFDKVYLYPPVTVPGVSPQPWGTVELEVFGHKGVLVCRTNEPLGPILKKYPGGRFPVFLRKESDSEGDFVGYLSVDKSGHGLYRWEFNAAGAGDDKYARPVGYHLLVGFRSDSGQEAGQSGKQVLMEGQFTLAFEARDTRVVGFKKEVKAARKGVPAEAKNPLFQKVEPFDPPIPNTVWWLVSIQPDFRNTLWQKEYCPRQKRYKAVF